MQQPAGAAAAAKKAEAQTVDPTTAAAWHIKEVAKFFGGDSSAPSRDRASPRSSRCYSSADQSRPADFPMDT